MRSWVQSPLGSQCCVLEQDILLQKVPVNTMEALLSPDMSKKLLTGILNLKTIKLIFFKSGLENDDSLVVSKSSLNPGPRVLWEARILPSCHLESVWEKYDSPDMAMLIEM